MIMKNIFFIFITSTIFLSCQRDFKVEEFCFGRAIINGEYIIRNEVLALAKDNDTSYNDLDTLYLKVDREKNFKFKLENKSEAEAIKTNPKYDLETYIYLKGSNQTEKFWKQTIVQHNLPKYTEDRIKVICEKDLTIEMLEMIKLKLNDKGYSVELENNKLSFEGDLKNEFIKFQKDNNFPFGKVDLKTLKKLGISVGER